jgi:putative transposase
MLCKALLVSQTGYYAWRGRSESEREKKDRRLGVLIREAHTRSRRRYGSPRVLGDLQAQGISVGRKRVIRLMRSEGLRGLSRRRYHCTTKSDHTYPIAANILNRQFKADAPNKRWVGDTTELTTASGKLYLAAIIDLYSRYLVGWALSTTNDRHLVLDALKMAVQRRKPGAGVLQHTDRGTPYACDDYQEMLQTNGMVCSMSRKGNCWDNAAMESWFSTLKLELGEHFETERAARRELFEYIEIFYNNQRRHSSIDNMSPAEYERREWMQKAA